MVLLERYSGAETARKPSSLDDDLLSAGRQFNSDRRLQLLPVPQVVPLPLGGPFRGRATTLGFAAAFRQDLQGWAEAAGVHSED